MKDKISVGMSPGLPHQLADGAKIDKIITVQATNVSMLPIGYQIEAE